MFLWAEGSDERVWYEDEVNFIKVFNEELWDTPIISSTSDDSSKITGNTGVKMNGPYAWTPPTYWLNAPSQGFHDENSNFNAFGGADGFATEISPGANPLSQQSLDKILPRDQ